MLKKEGILYIKDPRALTELFNQYKCTREGKQVVDIRFLLKGVLSLVNEKGAISLFYHVRRLM